MGVSPFAGIAFAIGLISLLFAFYPFSHSPPASSPSPTVHHGGVTACKVPVPAPNRLGLRFDDKTLNVVSYEYDSWSVFDVTKGKSHYGQGGGYNHFAGRDASRAFISGNFTGDGLTDSLVGLSSTEVKSVVEWRDFYIRTYIFVGKLVGRYYDGEGNPTKYLKGVEAKAARGAQLMEKQKKEEAKIPGCNSKWSQDEGSEVWCDDGYPRLVQRPLEIALTGKMSKRCACYKETELDQPATSTNNNMDYAYAIFLHLPNPTIFNWNTIIRGYSRTRNPNKSISVFVDMLRTGVPPDHLTYPFLTKAASNLTDVRLGLSVHGRVVRDGYESDRFIKNSLIHFGGSFKDVSYARRLFDEMPDRNLVSWNSILDCYVKCKEVSLAREVFDSMPDRDVVSWSSMIDGYVKCGEHGEALAVFRTMLGSSVDANEVTMVSVLGACAHLGALDQGIAMHRYITDKKILLTLTLRTSLVDMYAKCGAIEAALSVFRGIPPKQTDVLIWNAMIGGLATHGFVRESLEMFTEMRKAGIMPDEITYLCILSACAHGGLVNEAWHYFKILTNPNTEHYACMMDALARAGRLTEAYAFLTRMPMEPTASMLGALLNGCVKHRNLDLAEMVGRKLVELEPDHDGRYVGLSNVYAVIKRWDEARRMREAMEKRGVKKSPGWSFVEILGFSHRFIAHDKTHPESEQIYGMLSFLVKELSDLDSEMAQDCTFDSVECNLHII
ncbi:hypothetical protein OSB04_021808 [Centaurea solstitialis]|uniref:Cytochrome b5 heme-binding domain-containing protein n=1 Tax=Centaurea solstitialis TaxID=347529 RepID=A0AA38T6X3_9ASTR|nr:hypothetical protein OSB04_021808 [Centaurea solstitialis]